MISQDYIRKREIYCSERVSSDKDEMISVIE